MVSWLPSMLNTVFLFSLDRKKLNSSTQILKNTVPQFTIAILVSSGKSRGNCPGNLGQVPGSICDKPL